jgi:hypothetical protein
MKSQYYIERVTKKELEPLLLTYHYLKDESKTFKSHYNYGLFKYPDWECPLNIGGCLAGIIFSSLPVPEIAVGAFGLERNQQKGIYELSRLCIHPDIQKEEYNITSWFLSRCIRRFKKDANVSAILSYADSTRHNGIIYRACNFKYYGLTDPKKDFYYADGTKHSRGSVKGVEGEWKDRSRKHRYLMVFDKELEKRLTWKEKKWYNDKGDT